MFSSAMSAQVIVARDQFCATSASEIIQPERQRKQSIKEQKNSSQDIDKNGRVYESPISVRFSEAEGKVEESMKFMEEVDDIRKKKVSAELEYRNSMPASSYQQQKLRVCEICSAYLGIHDNDRRLADHFGGKLHLGFIKIREKLDALMVSEFCLVVKTENTPINKQGGR